jgi:hypothetical protein
LNLGFNWDNVQNNNKRFIEGVWDE